MPMTIILTHRGLDPARPKYFLEGSYEAFEDQLLRGFGLEVDLRFTRDGEIVISHDSTLTRISNGASTQTIEDLTLPELVAWTYADCHLTHFDELFSLFRYIHDSGICRTSMLALHLKAPLQERKNLDILLRKIAEHYVDPKHFIIFDLTPKSAAYLKERNPHLQLAASVAHPFDIERYGSSVSGTLLTLEEVIQHANLYSWAWLDEWDRTDRQETTKKLYTKETFKVLRRHDLKIVIVSPELHATSPALLAGEAHQDAKTHDTLLARMEEILAFSPDILCTDYPDDARRIAQEHEPFFVKIQRTKLYGKLKRFSPTILFSGLYRRMIDLPLDFIETSYNILLTTHIRPLTASQFALTPDRLREYPKNAVVLQGPILKKCNFTLETIKLYRKNFPNSYIILSTWEDEEPGIIAHCRDAGAIVILNKKPDYPGPSNANMQILSTRAGIAKATELGAEYVLKTRTDQRMYGLNLIEYLTNILTFFPVQGQYKQHKRIAILSFGAEKYYPYHFSDLFLFGDVRDLTLYWNFPLLTPEMNTTFFNPEVNLPALFLEKTGRHLAWTLEDGWRAYAEQCIVIDQSTVDFYWYKYLRYREYGHKHYTAEKPSHDALTFAEWFNLYSNLPNKIAPPDTKNIFRGKRFDSKRQRNAY